MTPPAPAARTQARGVPHPSGDDRYKALDRAMKRLDYERDALLEVLNAAQETFGFLSEELLIYVARQLSVPLARVYGVATFYHMFTFDPLGDHNCIVCTGTACHVKGADGIVNKLADEFAVEPGATTDDGVFSLTAARCLGSCGLAPVVVVDGAVSGKATPDAVAVRVRDLVVRARDRAADEQKAG